MEETVRAFNHVIEKGWAFYWGTSEWSADEISEACGIAKALGLIGPIVEQPLYNIIDRQKVEGEYQRLYSRCGIGLTTFSPLKMGLLTGKYNDADKGPPEGSRFAESKDRFAEFMRGQYGGEEWMGNVNKVKSLKVCHASFFGSSSDFPLSVSYYISNFTSTIYIWILISLIRRILHLRKYNEVFRKTDTHSSQ
jgi:hypothetical protein